MEAPQTETAIPALRIYHDEDVSRRDGFEPLLGGEPSGGQLTGTRALMLAVLEDGIRSYLSGPTLAAKDAEFWIQSHRRRSPFSFVVVCEVLGLDPDAVRTTVERMKAARQGQKGFPRARSNVRIPGRVCAKRTANRTH